MLNYITEENYGKYTPKQVKSNFRLINELVKTIGKKYEPNFAIETDFDRWLYNNIAYYFSNDPRCEWDLSKGLFFHGKKGTGKSLSMKIAEKIYYHRIDHGQFASNKSFRAFHIEQLASNIAKFKDMCKNSLFCDEVMRETKDDSKVIHNYGTKEQPFSEGVHIMYRSFCDKGKLYHFTCNYWNVSGFENGKLISDVYGSEIHDRLIEMCNFVEFKGESKRK